jgi:hypothetical protein
MTGVGTWTAHTATRGSFGILLANESNRRTSQSLRRSWVRHHGHSRSIHPVKPKNAKPIFCVGVVMCGWRLVVLTKNDREEIFAVVLLT